jgi:hypothetical protein
MQQQQMIKDYRLWVIISTVVFSLFAFAQIRIQQIWRILKPFLPRTRMEKFLQQHKIYAISMRRLVVDYDKSLGEGTWSNVYFGLLFTECHLFIELFRHTDRGIKRFIEGNNDVFCLIFYAFLTQTFCNARIR